MLLIKAKVHNSTLERDHLKERRCTDLHGDLDDH